MIRVVNVIPRKVYLLNQLHIKSIHTKENEYKCDVCGKVFFRRCNFLQYLKAVHDKIKSFVCNECDKTFSQCCDLKNHIRTHTKGKPF